MQCCMVRVTRHAQNAANLRCSESARPRGAPRAWVLPLNSEMAKWTLVIHGGASTSLLDRGQSQSTRSNPRQREMDASLRAGARVLAAGGSALDAVEAAVVSMEDDEAFNCGKGSVFTAAGTQEMDASIMTGHDLNCGAVAGLTRTRNPIRAARYVMESTPHVFFSGEGAEQIALAAGLPQEDAAYFDVKSRRDAL